MAKKNQLKLDFGDTLNNSGEASPALAATLTANRYTTDRYEYFVLIAPDEKVKASVKQAKIMLNSEVRIGSHNMSSIPHITLFKFISGMDSGFLKDMISASLQNIKGFAVELDGLHVFSHGHTSRSLVISIKDPAPIRTIDRRLRILRDSPREIVPHVTIARSLPVSEFNKISELHKYNVTGNFYCDRVTVLRKPVSNPNAHYEICTEIFLN